jgi:addiction module RelB/DinJ family antitoxin
MPKTAVINLKTDPALKKKAAKTAEKLGISLSAVLNNELRRFAAEQRVSFETPEIPNAKTARELEESMKEIEAGDYYGPFGSVEEMLASLHKHAELEEPTE